MFDQIWNSLKCVDENLLVLESAAILSLVVPNGVSAVQSSLVEWTLISGNLTGGCGAEGMPSARILQDQLNEAGLRLPSVLKGTLSVDARRAAAECADIINRSSAGSAPPHVSLAVLNFYSQGECADEPMSSSIARTIERAWHSMDQFLQELNDSVAVEESRAAMAPNFVEQSELWKAHDPKLVGDYYIHGPSGLGAAFQTINGWDSAWSMPPLDPSSEFNERHRYWSSLPHVALGPLGWKDPALGIARWILLGMPTSTPELALIASRWGLDALIYFSQSDWMQGNDDTLRLECSSQPAAQIISKSYRASVLEGARSLHMCDHFWRQFFSVESPELGSWRMFERHPDNDSPEFVVILDQFQGWYRTLTQLDGREFPGGISPDVSVTVIARPVGLLGTYRRSSQTGRWYSGSHEVHLLGFSQASAATLRPSKSVPAKATDHVKPSIHKTASAFWLASEICRRHPSYVLHGDGPDTGGELRLVSSSGPAIRISRVGTAGVEGSVREAIDLVEAHDKRELIRAIEKNLGLSVKSGSSPTTERTIVYRVLAQILALVAGEKMRWDITAVESVSNGSVWELLCGGESVATFLPNGDVVMTTGTVNLLERYNAHSRKLSAMIGDVFGSILP
ncbi:TY-Chap2 family putative peptide chaperone [Arthrobacter oryzae]|uniref:TY-Chap2 family putative peptide chaperone n=1 Tax=Arthrobacter oryzae TaxID=409290 RepID=UPI00278AD08D|nr:hypothetical protein [Arthrobacter oryzae]MDQ0076803.1 hypothetical protein [Arthrobacter oryzae]